MAIHHARTELTMMPKSRSLNATATQGEQEEAETRRPTRWRPTSIATSPPASTTSKTPRSHHT